MKRVLGLTVTQVDVPTLPGFSPGFDSLRRRLRSFGGLFVDNGLVIIIVGMFAAIQARTAEPYMLEPDSWLTFLGGREIAGHGVPHTDSLTIMSDGRSWIDQQWLAQLGMYKLERLVGVLGIVAICAVSVIAVFALACALARRNASARSVAIFAVPAFTVAFCALRAQVLSYLLFVPLFALLCSESRRPTRRVWIALPVLALWANLHGAVVVAAALVGLLGATDLVQRRLARGAGLIVGASLSLFATPYGLGILEYYRATMGNPMFKKYITEWSQPTFVSWIGMPFFLTAAGALLLVARRPRSLTVFEILALGVTLVGGLTAGRSVVWFAYASLLLLPPLLDDVWPERRLALPTRVVVGVFAAMVVAFAIGLAAHSAPAARERTDVVYPPAALRAVARALAADPRARVLPDDRTADWLLYELPSIRNRIAFDGRWEVLSQAQFKLVRNFVTQAAPGVERLTRGYSIFLVDRFWHPQLARWYAARPGLRVLYRGDQVIVYARR